VFPFISLSCKIGTWYDIPAQAGIHEILDSGSSPE
jgi:hypothetical protein